MEMKTKVLCTLLGFFFVDHHPYQRTIFGTSNTQSGEENRKLNSSHTFNSYPSGDLHVSTKTNLFAESYKS